MGSDGENGLKGRLRRLHARGLEGAECFALIVGGGVLTALTGYNLLQLVLFGRLYILSKHREEGWAYWPDERLTIIGHGVLNIVILVAGLTMMAIVLAYPLTLFWWGKHRPPQSRLPPLNIGD